MGRYMPQGGGGGGDRKTHTNTPNWFDSLLKMEEGKKTQPKRSSYPS